MQKLARAIGLDIRAREFAYGRDATFGRIPEAQIPEQWVRTTCGYCSVGCGLYLGVRDGKAVAVQGDPEHPVNRGHLCPKGRTAHHTIHSQRRATTPLMRVSGRLEPCSWDDALEAMRDRVQAVQRRYGNDALGIISTGQLVTEEFYALGKLVHGALSTKNYDGNTTLCMASAVSGYKRSFGSDGPPACYEDFALADCVMLIGANIADNHPILYQHLQANPSATVIAVDPRVTKTASRADIYLPVKPRTDIPLLNGIMHLLIERGAVDAGYIAARTTGYDELVAHLADWTPERVSELTGLSLDLLYRTADTIARSRATLFAWTMGVNHSIQGTETVNAINTLALITGNIGRPGAGPFSITGQCNAMGSREASGTSSLPGYRPHDDDVERVRLAAMWGLAPDQLPNRRGRHYPDILNGIIVDKVKALWIIATNPAVSFPNQNFLFDAFSRLEFLVVQDAFHPTPTSEVADLVLPSGVWGEKEGTYTNSERRISKVNAAVAPPGDARADFDIFLKLAEVYGRREQLFPGWTSPEDAFNEWRQVSAGRPCDYSGVSYERLATAGPVQWPCPDPDAAGAARLYADGTFNTPDGKARLWAVDWNDYMERRTPGFPLLLNTGRTVEHWHTRTKTGEVPLLDAMAPAAWLEMSPEDARALAVHPHDRVRVVSARGAVENVPVRITGTVRAGEVFMPFHWANAKANNLTVNTVDPLSGEPNFKQCAVRVEKA